MATPTVVTSAQAAAQINASKELIGLYATMRNLNFPTDPAFQALQQASIDATMTLRGIANGSIKVNE